MRCSACSTENPPQAKFCLECGAPLARRCSACGTVLPDVAKFCLECGQPIPAAGVPPTPSIAPQTYTPRHLAQKILASRADLEGERKQVTILFADVVGSTELIQGRDAEDAQALLDGVVRLMMEAVHRYEGTVSRLTGDGLMAMFGAPVAREDHAVRACYAALAMLEAARHHADEARRTLGVTISIRVGLSAGEVVVRTIRDDLHMDYTAMGETVHLAARMEQLAEPGTATLTAATLALVEGYVQVRSLGPVLVKGLPEPVEIFQLLGAGQARTRLQVTAARGLTRFVGREAEMAALHAALERAQTGQGQVVAMVGEPGVGKSRLVWEVTHSHRTQDWLVLESGSVSHGKATPWLPVIDLLKSYCRIEPRDDARAVREKVVGKLLALDEDLRPLWPALLALLDQPVDEPAWLALDAAQRRRRTLDGIKRLLLRESQVQPLLLIFEDLHWLDSETQALLASLVDGLPAARMVLLVNYRPEYRHEWGSKTYYTQVRVDPLAAEGVHALLGSVLGDDASLASVSATLMARTAGNPFFLEESIQTLVETGTLVGERGAYRLARAIDTFRVPATVQAMLAARIDRLAPEDKRLLQTASVVGKDVSYRQLGEIADLPDDALRAGLTQLQAAEFVYETALFPELEYTFKHALTHEVAYGSLLQDRRREVHGRVVEAIERLYPDRLDEHLERLAHHASRAERWEASLMYCWQAGRRAVGRSALCEALTRFEQALAALDRLPETFERLEQAIDVRLELRFVLQPMGEYQLALSHWQTAERLAERLDDHRRLSQARAAMAQSFYLLGSHDLGVAAGEHALALADDVGDDTTRASALWPLAGNYRSRGKYRRASTLQAELLALVKRKPSVMRVQGPIFVRGELACTLAELGSFAEAVALGDESVHLARLDGSSVALAHALFFLGTVYVCRGYAEETIALLDQCVSLCERDEIHSLYPGAATRLAAAYVLHARGDEAVLLAERSIERAAAINRTGERSMRAAGLGDAYLAVGRLSDARAQAEQAIAFASATGERGYQAWASRLLGEILVREVLHDAGGAEQHYCEALGIAETLEMRPLQAHCHLGLGKLYRAVGRLEQAQAELTTAVQMLREMEMTFWLPEAESELAQSDGSVPGGHVG